MLINPEKIYSYNELLNQSLKLSKLYPRLISVIHIGRSRDNRELFMLKLGKGDRGTLNISGVHGRESVNPTVILSIIEHYVHRYYSIGSKILDNYSLYFIPVLNPDGYVIATEGYFSINSIHYRTIAKQTNIPNSEYRLNANAIDINRNFSCESYVKTDISGMADNEPETKALIKVCRDYHFYGLIDYHSRGEAIFYHRKAMDYAYNKRQFHIACELAKYSGYKLYTLRQENPDGVSGGNTVNFFSERYHRPAITVETVPDEATFPLNAAYCRKVFKEIKNMPMEFLRILTIL